MISVALCTYNGERYIREQLESILNQTMPVDEIVVCDDGSTDNTLHIIESIRDGSHTDIRIYCNEKNLGPAYNFQKNIDLCCGDIIFLSDQDDVWYQDKVSNVIDYFSRNPNIDTVFTNATLIDNEGSVLNGSLWDHCFDKDVKTLFDAGLKFECFAYGNHATGATMAIRKQKLPNINYNSDFLHDHALAVLAANNDSLGYINQCLTYYRLHGNQVCGISKDVPITWYDLTHPMKEVVNLPLRDDKRERIEFNSNRITFRKHLWGPLEILIKRKQYKRLYKQAYRIVMMMDIRASINHKLQYLQFKRKK